VLREAALNCRNQVAEAVCDQSSCNLVAEDRRL
jgi:hypothetical protein